jgi:predicted Zn-dependent protease with MMP-like domain
VLESILVAGASNAHEHRNMILSYFDINCYNLLLRHYCSKQDWPNAIQLFQALLDSTDAVKPKANYVSLIMIHELARALGHAEDLKIPDESLMAL